MSQAISAPSVLVNNTLVLIVPNSLSYTEGKGEQNVRVQSGGGGTVDIVSSNNVETNMSDFKFSIINTAENINLARSWKSNGSANALQAVDNVTGFTRTVNSATLVNNYEVNLGSDTTVDLEFMGIAAV